MATTLVSDAGVAMVAPGFAVAGDGGAGHGGAVIGDTGVSAIDVLPFTGTGPGTLPLVIAGLVSLLAGGIALLLGRRRAPRGRKMDGALPDLSTRAEEVAVAA